MSRASGSAAQQVVGKLRPGVLDRAIVLDMLSKLFEILKAAGVGWNGQEQDISVHGLEGCKCEGSKVSPECANAVEVSGSASVCSIICIRMSCSLPSRGSYRLTCWATFI